MKRTVLSCCVCMLLPVLPGPEIIFWPVHEKVQQILEKVGPIFGNKFFQPTFFSPAPFELFSRNFGHLATPTAAQPPTPTSPFPSLPSILSLSPLTSLAALQLTAQLVKY